MRIAQIIDSLEIGGAERMAVNYANAIYSKTHFSALVTTRFDGPLKADVATGVILLSLHRKSTLDVSAILKLRKFCIENKISHLHAHGTSYFVAALLKIIRPKVKIIWHDHYGLSEFLDQRKSGLLKFISGYFCAIISVNEKLRSWAVSELKCQQVIFLPNFTQSVTTHKTGYPSNQILEGTTGKKIVCLANLRAQKNHFLLLKVAGMIKTDFPEWTFHLVGKDFKDEYSRRLNEAIKEQKLEHTVFLYGSRSDSAKLIAEADICVLSSKSEGLPVALIEYGMHGKAVLATKVGDVAEVITDGLTGFLAESDNENEFCAKLLQLISSVEIRKDFGRKLRILVASEYSKEVVVDNYFQFIQQVCP